MTLDVKKIRSDFPNLHIQVYGKPLVYLDNAATTFKPKCVIEAMDAYYSQGTSNVHRGVHYLSEHATQAFEEARKTVAKFLNAAKPQEIVFTRGTTESINLVAQSYGRAFLKPGDEILISHMEHHSNIVPWQILCEQTGCVLKVAPINRQGEIIWKEFLRLLNPKTKIVSVVWVSNSLGTVNPVENIIKEAHQRGAVVLVDGAQAVTHAPVDVLALDCDFFVFSGHKIFGPTGIGVLYGKEKLLEKMPPYQGGGDMISSVTFPKTTYNVLPYKFEAGTPAIAQAIGLG
ncbi:MAG: aminotransferase class V-fold PLP-dependent enzyme, partial [Candidatus Omnitrophica bacterium]|nr:aminotransferase class V-fold PLP-dependent enzyme [Candidatus Omnitrophota bacterium]